LKLAFYETSTERIREDLVDIKRRTKEVGKIKGILRPALPDLASSAAVISAVSALTAGGIKDIGFYSYGHIRNQSLAWIAVAFAEVDGR
jgi:hypothetical protein